MRYQAYRLMALPALLFLATLLSLAGLQVLPLANGLHTPATIARPSESPDFGRLPLSFEPNRGQTDPSVRYMAHASGGTMYFTLSEVVLALQSIPTGSRYQSADARGSVGLALLSMSDKANSSAGGLTTI